MNLYKRDYRKLYQLQDKFLLLWETMGLPFYLTGGTALGRYYLNHRYSEDLDFFINASPKYKNYITTIQNTIGKHFNVNLQESLFTEDYTRLFINDNELFLKLEFVNDIESHCGSPLSYSFGMIDNPANILSNKLTAIIGRDEPKDIFDIVFLSLNYSFHWQEIFADAKRKSVINEIDIEQRLYNFPVEWLENVDWMISDFDFNFFKSTLAQIANDFLLGKENTVGINKISIDKAITLKT